MEKLYALYSKTRKVLYINDKPNTDFWSLYLRSKYTKDKWCMFEKDGTEYRRLVNYLSINNIDYNRVNLIDSSHRTSKKLIKEINLAMNQLAIMSLTESVEGARDEFLVCKSVKGEAVVMYMGYDINEALRIYKSVTGIQYIEVWRNGVFCDYIDNMMEYEQLREKRNTQNII